MSVCNRFSVFGGLTFSVLTSALFAADAPPAEHLEFFEKQVRPLLVQHCQECHGPKKQEAGLRLDSRKGLLKGTDSSPVVVPGNVDNSRLLQVLNYSANDTQMPPKGKLSAEQIAVFRKWLELGTPWPEEAAVADTSPFETARNHWAFQPVKRPPIPAVVGQTSGHSIARSPIDSFIATALNSKGLALSSPADRYTSIRRATFDLWGIPPTIEQVREFEADSSPDAHERLIDRLLASPLYGQRWARHWLDVARYADTKGYVFTAEPRYPYSYTYRDYVVDAFNSDKPFDEFVVEQLAADQLVNADAEKATPYSPLEANDARLAAMGFLTVGRRFLNNNHDIIDDRIDVVSRGLLGLTVGCARCHDHKFDPVPTADYYSLYGVFASSVEPDDLPIIGTPQEAAAFEVFQKEFAKRERAVADFEQQSLAMLRDELRERSGDCLQQLARQSNNWLNLPAVFTGKGEPRPPVVKRWEEYINRLASSPHPIFAPWHKLSKVAPAEFSKEIERLCEAWMNTADPNANIVNLRVRQTLIEYRPATLIELAKLYGSMFEEVRREWESVLKATPDAKSLADEAAEQIRQVLYGEGSPAMLSLEESRRVIGRDVRDKITQLKRQVENLKVTSPGAPPRAMVMRDGSIQQPKIFIRGNPARQGKDVPRQFLEVVSGRERKPFTQGSGRLELALAIVDPTNPLTPRVLVNRVWQHHFGTGLVPTPSDFGTRGLPPSNPDLLNWLACEAAGVEGTNAEKSANRPSAQRWSLKRLHRLILASSVYRQSSADNPAARAVDSENRLLWKMPRQRLDFEAMRDSLLAVSGQLDPTLGGRPFENQMDLKSNRRTIYGLVNRNDLPGVFRAFDFADTEASAAERPQTTVPQQALFALNAPFVQDQARRLAAGITSVESDETARVVLLYQLALARNPSSEERELALRFIREALTTPTEKLTPWERLAQVVVLTNEFMFVD